MMLAQAPASRRTRIRRDVTTGSVYRGRRCCHEGSRKARKARKDGIDRKGRKGRKGRWRTTPGSRAAGALDAPARDEMILVEFQITAAPPPPSPQRRKT